MIRDIKIRENSSFRKPHHYFEVEIFAQGNPLGFSNQFSNEIAVIDFLTNFKDKYDFSKIDTRFFNTYLLKKFNESFN